MKKGIQDPSTEKSYNPNKDWQNEVI
uniref:Uncharacterized protein n=1 Tax=Vitis vinifera TaxID=29760 RepID=F6I1Q9_VITVI